MAGPLTGAGAAPEPTEYATLPMDRYITGLWTQRSLLRDADVPYLYGKFYSASRYDSLCDGLNRELSAELTLDRAAGATPYWAGYPDAYANSFYSYKWIQDGIEQLNVLVDGQSDIWNATPGIQNRLFNKITTNKTRFVGVNTELFFTDGINKKKWLRAGKAWGDAKKFTVGNYIIDTNGNIQSFLNQATTLTITNLEIVSKILDVFVGEQFVIVTLSSDAPKFPALQLIALSGITNPTFAFLDGISFSFQNIEPGWNLGLGSNQFAFNITHAPIASAATSGTVTTSLIVDSKGNNLTGVTGGSQPAWNPTAGTITQDGTVTWYNYGSPLQDWTQTAPTEALLINNPVNIGYGYMYWAATLDLSGYVNNAFAVLDSNRSFQVATVTAGSTGPNQPQWNTALGGKTNDGDIVWMNVGTPANWLSGFQYGTSITCILDSNGNLQFTTDYFQTQTIWTAGTANTNGATDVTSATEPTWNNARGGTTTDTSYTWTNAGPAQQLSAGTYQYSYSYHCIDGSVTTAAPLSYIVNPVIGIAGLYKGWLEFNIPNISQIDAIWLWRTAGGQQTLVFLDSIQRPPSTSLTNISYFDVIPDTSTLGQQALIPQIPAPISKQNDAPPDGMTAPVYHMGRIWGIVDNAVVYSGGPDTITGNGNTSFPPLNSFPFQEQPIKIRPITIQGGGTIVYTTTSTYLIPGFGTQQQPFSQPQVYMGGVGIMSYDAEEIVGSTSYLFTTKRKFCSLDPSAGYIECGYPIGDQFTRVTTGGINAALYNPASTFVTWHEASSGDTAIYVCDGNVGWFRYSPISTPESGYVWSPRRAVVGGTSAVQSVETSPGINSMLIGPSAGGPILMRDTSTNQDNGTPYPSWFTIGNITLCESGQIAEVAHIALKSPAVGARPSVSVLFGELFATPDVPFDQLQITGNDPPDLPASVTMYSNRYAALQNGVAPLCDNFQFKVDYGIQNFPDRLLKHSIYGAHHEERRQQ